MHRCPNTICLCSSSEFNEPCAETAPHTFVRHSPEMSIQICRDSDFPQVDGRVAPDWHHVQHLGWSDGIIHDSGWMLLTRADSQTTARAYFWLTLSTDGHCASQHSVFMCLLCRPTHDPSTTSSSKTWTTTKQGELI